MYAVIDPQGNLRNVLASGEQAIREAQALSPLVQIQANSATDGLGAQLSGLGRVLSFDQRPQNALRISGLSRVNAREVMALSTQQAHSKVRKYFPQASYASASYMVRELLGQNTKTMKETPVPSLVMGLSLMPYDHANRFTRHKLPMKPVMGLCEGSTEGCRSTCLVYSGKAYMNAGVRAKLSRTEALLLEPEAFCRILVDAVNYHLRTAPAEGFRPFVRLNVFSDVPWELVFPELFAMFPQIGFYDYTKVPGRVTPNNYDLTFSWSGKNEAAAKSELARGRRVAVVFMLPGNLFERREGSLPKTFYGLPVTDGDVHDVRPFDPGRIVVGLRWKMPLGLGKGQKAPQSFVVQVEQVDGALAVPVSASRTAIEDPDLGEAHA